MWHMYEKHVKSKYLALHIYASVQTLGRKDKRTPKHLAYGGIL